MSARCLFLPVLLFLVAGCDGASTRSAAPALRASRDSALAADSVAVADRGCLPYDPHGVTITGVLEERTYPGPPGYGETPEQDVREKGYYVVPDQPLCTLSDGEYNDARRGVELVQMVFVNGRDAAARPFLGRRVAATGALFVAVWGHHHAPILLRVQRIVPVEQGKAVGASGLRVALR